MVRSIRDIAERPYKEEEFTLTLDFATDDTTITQDIRLNGIVMNAFFVVPALDGSQCTFYLMNGNDRQYYSSGLLDESTTHLLEDIGTAMVDPTIKIITASSQLANRAFKFEPVFG